MDLIYKKTGVRYYEVHIYRVLHKWEFKSKVPQKKFVNTASKNDTRKSKKSKTTDSLLVLLNLMQWKNAGDKVSITSYLITIPISRILIQ